MGNYNSGRYGGKTKCENCLSIDVRKWAHSNLLANGTQFQCQWPNGNQIAVKVEDGRVILQYAISDAAMKDYYVWLAYTPCNFGGQRAWFQCPCCNKRMANLFFKHGRFACRDCQRLRYHSQSLDALQRNHCAYNRLKNKLDDLDLKPKGMHWQTFWRLIERMENVDQKINQAFLVSFGGLLARLEK